MVTISVLFKKKLKWPPAQISYTALKFENPKFTSNRPVAGSAGGQPWWPPIYRNSPNSSQLLSALFHWGGDIDETQPNMRAKSLFSIRFFFNISKTESHHATTSWINWAMGNPRPFLCTMKCRKHRCCLFKLSNKFPDGSSRVCYRLVGLTNVVNAKLEHVCKIFQATNIRVIRNLLKVCTNSDSFGFYHFLFQTQPHLAAKNLATQTRRFAQNCRQLSK